jgi:hypothetical protein
MHQIGDLAPLTLSGVWMDTAPPTICGRWGVDTDAAVGVKIGETVVPRRLGDVPGEQRETTFDLCQRVARVLGSEQPFELQY